MTARPHGWTRPAAAVVSAVLAAAGCGDSGPDGPPEPEPGGGVRLVEVADLDQPVSMAVRPDDPAIYVVEQSGRVRALRDGRLDPRPLVDLRDEVSSGNEQGLLGIAFAPDGRHLYLDYTDQAGDTHVTEWALGPTGAVDPDTRRDVLVQSQPFANHNGGQLAFGPDGHLYIALGDGGSAGDPQGNAQRLDTLLGKILRIDPRPDGGRPYRIPEDNPFAGRSGARPEIWAYGLRNPWRFSFDPKTGDLWIGDVGQGDWEEVNHEPGGSGGGVNYGWNRREGRHDFQGGPRPGMVDPALEYRNGEDGACAVVGGHVYRGSRIPQLAGNYVYGDFCAGFVNAVPAVAGTAMPSRPILRDVAELSSFGVDASGELYLLTRAGPVYRLEPA